MPILLYIWTSMELKISVPKTFRYEVFTSGKQPSKVLFALHGYGQLSKYFIRKFQNLGDDWLIIAPEGMHRFYLKGSSGRVGASWMTKEAREDDIEDNYVYLNTVLDKIKTNYPNILEFHLLGFSQGGATAARWAVNSKEFKSILLWACVFPPDVSDEINYDNLKSKTFVIGSDDEYFNEDQQQKTIEFYRNRGFETKTYNGTHTIYPEILDSILND